MVIDRVEALQPLGHIGAHGGQVEVGLVEPEAQAQQFADAGGGQVDGGGRSGASSV